MGFHQTKAKITRVGLRLAAALSLIALSGGATLAQTSGDPVKIGLIADKSSTLVSLSQNEEDALRAAGDAINSGVLFWGVPPATSGKSGILGRPIEFLIEDAGTDPNLALSKARRLASEGAQAIMVLTTSGVTLQARLVCEEAKIICFGISVASPAIVTQPHAAFAFTQAPTFTMQGDAMVGALKAIGASRVAIVRDDSGATQAQAGFFTKVLQDAKIDIVTDEVVSAGSREMSGQLLRVKNANPQAVIDLVNPAVDGAVFLKAFKASGIEVPLFAQGGLISQPDTWKLAGSTIDGTIAFDYLSPASTMVDAFKDYFRKKYGADQPILSTHVMPVTALLLIKRAMEDAGTTSGDAVAQAMAKITNFPAGWGQAGYTINYKADDHNGSTMKSIVIVQFADGTPSKEWGKFQTGGE